MCLAQRHWHFPYEDANSDIVEYCVLEHGRVKRGFMRMVRHIPQDRAQDFDKPSAKQRADVDTGLQYLKMNAITYRVLTLWSFGASGKNDFETMKDVPEWKEGATIRDTAEGKERLRKDVYRIGGVGISEVRGPEMQKFMVIRAIVPSWKNYQKTNVSPGMR